MDLSITAMFVYLGVWMAVIMWLSFRTIRRNPEILQIQDRQLKQCVMLEGQIACVRSWRTHLLVAASILPAFIVALILGEFQDAMGGGYLVTIEAVISINITISMFYFYTPVYRASVRRRVELLQGPSCPDCGSELGEDVRINCPGCGAPAEPPGADWVKPAPIDLNTWSGRLRVVITMVLFCLGALYFYHSWQKLQNWDCGNPNCPNCNPKQVQGGESHPSIQ